MRGSSFLSMNSRNRSIGIGLGDTKQRSEILPPSHKVADGPPPHPKQKRQLRKASSAYGATLGVRFRGVWCDDDPNNPTRRSPCEAAPASQPSQVVLPPSPFHRHLEQSQDVLMPLEMPPKGDTPPKGVLRNKGEMQASKMIKYPLANKISFQQNRVRTVTVPIPPLANLAVTRSTSLPTLLKKETDSAHTRKRWDDPTQPQIRNNLLPLQMPRRKACFGEETNGSSLSREPLSPVKPTDSLSEDSSLDEGDAGDTSILHGSDRKRLSLLEVEDNREQQQQEFKTTIQKNHSIKGNRQASICNLSVQSFYNGGHSESALEWRRPSYLEILHRSDSDDMRSCLEQDLSSDSSPSQQRSEEGNSVVAPPTPPRRVVSPVTCKKSSESVNVLSIGDSIFEAEDALNLPSKKYSHELTQHISSAMTTTDTISSATQTMLALAKTSADIARRRRSDLRTYTEPLERPTTSTVDGKVDVQSMTSDIGFYHDICDLKSIFSVGDEYDRLIVLALYPESVGRCFEILALSKSAVSAEEFWRRYFWRCSEKRILKALAEKKNHTLFPDSTSLSIADGISGTQEK